MSDDDVTERARQIVSGAMFGLTTPMMVDAIVSDLDAAGLLATPEHDAAVAAKALREAADEMRHIFLHKGTTLGMPADDWLLDRADSIERREGGAS